MNAISKNNKMSASIVIVSATLMLVSCATTPATQSSGDPTTQMSLVERLQEAKKNALANRSTDSFEDVIADSSQDSGAGEPIEVFGSGVFIDTGRASWQIAETSPNGKGTILKFEMADVQNVTKTILGDILGENYVVDPSIKTKITLHTSRPIPKSALISTFENILRMNDLALVRTNGLYSVIPDSHARAALGVSRNRVHRQHGYQSLVMPLANISAHSMLSILESVKPQKVVLAADDSRNIVMATGTQQELENILSTVKIYDVDQMKGMSVGIYPLKAVEASVVVDEIKVIYDLDDGGPMDGMLKMQTIDRLNAIMVVTPQINYLAEIKAWIDRLDKVEDISGREMYVFHVEHGRADHLARLLGELFGTADSDRDSGLGSGSSEMSPSPIRAATKSRSPGPAGSSIKIVADDLNNSLLILASRTDYAVVRAALRRLDVVPKQVLIEATIFEVALTDELSYGLQWFYNNTFNNGYGGTGELFPLDVTPSFGYTLFDSGGQVRGVLNALAADSRLNIISSPSLLVQDNQTATIRVGDEVPVRTSESTSIATSGLDPIITSTIQYRDTGVLLQVQPRVNASGQITMEIVQEVNGVDLTTSSGIDSPTIFQRSINTVVTVQSGESIILGGLITESESISKNGVPFLRRVPVLGAMFGSTTNSKDRAELLVMITATAVPDNISARMVTDEMKKKMPALFDEMGKSRWLGSHASGTK
jgi:general secretion pathway protein D